MGYVAGGFAVVVGFALLIASVLGLTGVFMEDDWSIRKKIVIGVMSAVVLVGVTSALLYGAVQVGDANGPCVRKESSITYDPTTKTPREYTYCAEYGTWVE